MYHYQKNIGDYRSATMHLSLLEHGVYNQLLDWYYLDEQPLPIDNRTLFRRLSAKTEAEQQAVLDVLAEMFIQADGGWTHKRVEREIAQYKAKAQQAREAGKLGGRPSKKGIGSGENRDGFDKEPGAKPTANREPINPSTNQPKEEAPRKRSATTAAIAQPDDVDAQTWADWLALRKSKRAPVTQTVVDGARTEAQKAGMTLDAFLQVWCLRGSQGLHADWLRPDERSTVSRISAETVYQRSMRLRMQEAAPESARKDPSRPQENVIDFFAVEVPAKRLEIGNEPATSLG